MHDYYLKTKEDKASKRKLRAGVGQDHVSDGEENVAAKQRDQKV